MGNNALTPAQVFADSDQLAYLQWNQQGCFCLRTQASENNIPRVVQVADQGACRAISPKGLAVRTRVHEYGGRPYLVSQGSLYFCRDDTQQIMQIDIPSGKGDHWDDTPDMSRAKAITPDTSAGQLRYADFDHDPARQRLYAIREDHRSNPVINSLVAINLPGKTETVGETTDEGEILFCESDFIASPRLSPDGKYLAFITWSHPNMPWDNTELHVLALREDGQPHTHHVMSGVQDGAIQQLQFDATGKLWFISDVTGWWQLYCFPNLSDVLTTANASLHINDATPAFTPELDCASPPWIVGQQQYAVTHDNHLICASVAHSLWRVHQKSADRSDKSTVIADNLSHVESIACHGGRIRMIAGTPDKAGALLEYARGQWHPLIQPELLPVSVDSIIAPVHITYETGTGVSGGKTNQAMESDDSPHEQAHALLYLPEAATTSRPPLIVTVHGGPSSSAKAWLNPMTQYWLQQGFAILDVDHRGSTGYGRRYRKRLYGDWGKIDIEDIIAAVHYVSSKQLINPDAVFIRGGSAGGYAVLAALCHSDLFKGGACYYGISDMAILAKETHKFESHYVEQLIGPLPAYAERYRERSPIHHIDKIQSPVLFLHGALDKVVPPQQAERLYQVLQPRIPGCQLITFANEAHGFRKTENQIKALEAETAFYNGILSQR